MLNNNADQIVRFLNDAMDQFKINEESVQKKCLFSSVRDRVSKFQFCREKMRHSVKSVANAKIKTCYGKMNFNEQGEFVDFYH